MTKYNHSSQKSKHMRTCYEQVLKNENLAYLLQSIRVNVCNLQCYIEKLYEEGQSCSPQYTKEAILLIMDDIQKMKKMSKKGKI